MIMTKTPAQLGGVDKYTRGVSAPPGSFECITKDRSMKPRALGTSLNYLKAQLGGVDQYSRSVPIIASTPDPVEGEAITSWDLARFAKNSPILWAHDAMSLPIGTATDVEWDPVVGLKMRVHFARAEANPLAEQVYQGVIDGIVRAVSVGYAVDEKPIEDPAYAPARAVRSATLLEVSFVPIGLDEDAGTPALNPAAAEDPTSPEELGEPNDEETRKLVSAAASHLAKHRAKIMKQRQTTPTVRMPSVHPPGVGPDQRTDKGDYDPSKGDVLRMDRGPIRLDNAQTTPAGGRIIPARLSRTGVLAYMNADGSTRRELRLAEEIFKADSLATLEHAVVIDIAHHTGMVTPDTWKKASLGHVSNVRQDGKFIIANLVIEDGATLDAIANGERTEISCGYRCRLDPTPGVHEGEAYDCVQREIRYNHAALCPPNRGRAGPDVGLRLDEKTPWAIAHFDNEKEIDMIKVRFDGKEYEEGSREHLDALERHHIADIDAAKKKAKEKLEAVEVEKTDLQKRLDVAEGARDAAAKELEDLKLDAKTKAADVKKSLDDVKKGEDERVLRRVRLMRMALRFFGKDEKDDDDDEDKMDSLTEREIQVKVVKKHDPKFVDEGKSDDYVLSRFDAVCDFAKKDRGINGVARVAHEISQNLDAAGTVSANDPVTAARKRRDEHAANAWKTNGQAPAK